MSKNDIFFSEDAAWADDITVRALHNAGGQVYLVGGAVRDALLGLATKDRDFVVVGATPTLMLELGFSQVGKDFPVFLHPTTKEEYALARTERKSGMGYHGFELRYDASVSLEEDLQRRDLTINALAADATGKLIDPYGGLHDLQAKQLHHVSAAFSEDPLRVLRVARFAARFSGLGFTVASDTLALMRHISQSGELTTLAAERVWAETERALSEADAQVYFEVLRACGALSVLFPEVDALFGVPQRADYHPEVDTGIHTLLSLKQSCLANASTKVRFSVLVHDLGKALTPQDILPRHIGHEARGVSPVQQLCARLKVPKAYEKLAVAVCRHHLKCHKVFELNAKTTVKLLGELDGFRNPDLVADFTLACRCDARGRTGFEDNPYIQAKYLKTCLDAASKIGINNLPDAQRQALLAQNAGVKIADAIHKLRIQAVAQVKAQYEDALEKA